MEILKVETKEQLKALNDCSAMTWEGLIEEDFGTALDMCGAEGAKGYVTKGKVMNEICHLTGDNAYPDDLTIFSIDKFKGLAIMVGARWMDDIISNNADREGYYPF
ncbi:hypothetical protein [Intestinibacter sp.]|uniref:hypothetical protein n=1 Tax=Intestinibacter sp. TaxID=1965304 RepID=UPI002A7485BB|nr:hypothetical protein [Intestinibacter sp.]MDY2735918.1 hypothetical protein [Intestinibacter sp.]